MRKPFQSIAVASGKSARSSTIYFSVKVDTLEIGFKFRYDVAFYTGLGIDFHGFDVFLDSTMLSMVSLAISKQVLLKMNR